MSIHHPLSQRSADRLFWRQEWSRHWTVWLNGLALWLWLFLIPGPLTEESEVLRLSILFTGCLALMLAGDDLRRGIDPLVHCLPLPPERRWHLRTLTAVAGGCLFYLAGIMAASGRWAWHLWQPVANGPFVGDRTSGRIGFDHWQALGILCLVGVVICLITANYRSRLGAVLATLGVVLTAFVLGGAHPIATHAGIWFSGRTAKYLVSPELQAALIGIISWISAAVFWMAGTRFGRRRSPLHSTAQPPTSLIALTGAVGILIATSWVYLLLGIWSSLGYFLQFGYPSRFWHLWGTAELALFGVWWWKWRRATVAWQAEPVAYWVRWLGAASALMAVAHLAAQPVHSLLLISRSLRSEWRGPAPTPMVTTSQSWAEAEAGKHYDPAPTSLDVIVWSHHDNRPTEPISLATTVMPLPATADAATSGQLTLAPGSPGSEIVEIELQLRWVETSRAGETMIDPVTGAAVGRDRTGSASLYLQLYQRQPGAKPVRMNGSGFACMAVFGKGIFLPDRRAISRESPNPETLGYSLALIPQRPGQPTTARLFHDAVRTHSSQPLHADLVYFKKGIWGLESVFSRAGQPTLLSLILPGFVLGGYLLLRSRFGGLHLFAATCLFLIACSWADGRRIQKELALSRDPTLPQQQRDFARTQAAISYFHRPPKSSH